MSGSDDANPQKENQYNNRNNNLHNGSFQFTVQYKIYRNKKEHFPEPEPVTLKFRDKAHPR